MGDKKSGYEVIRRGVMSIWDVEKKSVEDFSLMQYLDLYIPHEICARPYSTIKEYHYLRVLLEQTGGP